MILLNGFPRLKKCTLFHGKKTSRRVFFKYSFTCLAINRCSPFSNFRNCSDFDGLATAILLCLKGSDHEIEFIQIFGQKMNIARAI